MKEKNLKTYLLGYLLELLAKQNRGIGVKTIDLCNMLIEKAIDSKINKEAVGNNYQHMQKEFKISKATVHKVISALIECDVIAKKDNKYLFSEKFIIFVEEKRNEIS